MRSRLLPVLASTVLLLGACGDTDGETFDTADDAKESSCPSAPTPVDAPAGSTKDLMTKPEVVIPDGPAPSELQVSDIIVGKGDLACSGVMLEMQYVGVLYEGGKQFDASWDRGEPFSFTLGAGKVIGGWDQGIIGMRQGGRRQLVIPAELGYGERGAGSDIPPGAPLVFVVDVVGVTGG
jgi:peptidylprolyl isomerase